MDGDRPIGELEAGDKVWAYNTETGENEAKEITAVIVTETDVIVHVKTSDGEDIETTMFHPFYVVTRNPIHDVDYPYDNRHSHQESGGSVYDGEWKAASNLLAGDVLQKIDGSTVYVTEVTVEKLPEIINVYNLEIEDLHTYYVADGVLVHNEYSQNDKSPNVDEGGSDIVPKSLLQGKSDTRVYYGIKDGKKDYVGITNDLSRRQTQHGERFDRLIEITDEPLTRRQARAIEQVLIEDNLQFSNKINSISSKRDWYDDATGWARKWLSEHSH